MHFHHLHFYVRDAAFWRDWFVRRLSFQSVPINPTPTPTDHAKSLAATPEARCLNEQAVVAAGMAGVSSQSSSSMAVGYSAAVSPMAAAAHSLAQPWGERVVQGQIDIRLSDPMSSPAAADYLKQHPPGVVDVAFATDQFDHSLSRLGAQGATLLGQTSLGENGLRQCRIKGWADLCHSLVEVSPSWVKSAAEQCSQRSSPDASSSDDLLSAVDHVVLNVPQGELTVAVEWYQQLFGLERGQQFDIQTAQSGLRSQVLVHPEGSLQLPINEPSSANSQIQEFLNHNRGAGVQHVALRSNNAVDAISQFRQRGLDLISVPKTYYDGLHQRSDCPLEDTTAASAQQLLLDWAKGGHQGLLMQTFTKPIFSEPTFFFEIIERGLYAEQGQLKSAQGFGQGNFQALFEAIERAQLERGTLQ
ncbi:MAG: VOC family protein [Cyanobacteria bacterium P01_F01_bin.53]